MTKNSCCCENADYNKKTDLIEEFTALVKEKGKNSATFHKGN